MLISGRLPEYPERVLVLGCGRFGSSAAAKIARLLPGCHIHLADKLEQIPPELPGTHHSGTDAIEYLQEYLNREKPNDPVVPCIPIHVAFNWVLSRLGFCIPVPIHLMETLPGSVAGNDGCIYTSLSDFRCPDACIEPEGACAVTEEKRREPLFRTVERISIDLYRTLVIRSGQLLPGIEALTSMQLFDLLDEARKKKGRCLIGTVSRCHGVIHGFIH